MVKINSRTRSMVILNSSDLYLNSVIETLISAKKKECSISTDKAMTFVELIQLSKNHVGEITPLVCQVLFERNDDSGINLRRCDSTLCFINKLCSNTFNLPTTTDILFSNQHRETSNKRKEEESNLNLPQKVEPKNEENLSKDAETHGLSNKTVNISQCENVIGDQLTSGIAPTDLGALIYKGHQQQNNPIYEKNEENNEWKLFQKKKGSQANTKMFETFHICEDTNYDAFCGGSSLQSNKPSSTTAEEKENLSPSLFKSIIVSKSLLNIPNHVNKSRGNVDCDETASVNVDVENVATRDYGEGFKFPTDENKNNPRCSEGNQISKKDESFIGSIPSSAKFGDLISSPPPNHNSLGIQISNENFSFFDSLSNYGQSCDSATTNENYCSTPFEDNLICSQKPRGDSSCSDSISLNIDSGNQNICNKLENLVQELRKVVVYQCNRGCCYPRSKCKPQNRTMIQTNKNFHIESSTIFVNVRAKDLPPKFRGITSDDEEPTCSNLSKCCGTDSVQFTKNVNKSLRGFCFKTLPKKSSKTPLKKKSSLYCGKRCFSKYLPAYKRKNVASHCSFPCGGTFCCFRHINKPNCNCCNKCVFLKQTCGTTYDANEGCNNGKGTNNKKHSDNARQVSQTFGMKDENKKFLLFSSNGTPKKTSRNDKQTSTMFTHTEMIHTEVSTESNSNLHIASKSSIKPELLIFRNNDKCNSKNRRKTHPVRASEGANSDCIIVPVSCNDTAGNTIKRPLKNNHRFNIIRNHSRKLNNLESAHILFPNKPKSKKYLSKLMDGLMKKENCTDHSVKCKNNCKEKKMVDNVSIRRQKEKIMEDVVGGVELVLDSIKELKKIVYEENF